MEKANFTAGRVEGFKCKPGKEQSFLWDAISPGLGLRVTAAGAKSYVFQGKLNGTTIRITIGDPRTWSIAEAQAEARRLKVLLDENKDPRQIRAHEAAVMEAQKAEAKRQALTLGDVWPVYLEAYRRKWSDRHYRDHIKLAAKGGEARKRSGELTIPGPLASLMGLQLTALTSEIVVTWLEKEAARRPTSAARSYRLLRGFIRWADGEKAYSGLVPVWRSSNFRHPDGLFCCL